MRFVTPEKQKKTPVSETPATLEVIAAGMPRCATSSLQQAFETTLGLSPSMHFSYIQPSAERLKLCHAALLETDKTQRQAILHKLFDGYLATSDFPGMAFVEDLMEMYPSAKLVLNKRSSAEAWVKSFRDATAFYATKTYLAICYWVPTDYWHYQIRQVFPVISLERYGTNETSTEKYEAHLDWVRGLAKKKGRELLEWTPEMGYAPLCEFLGKEVPEELFPRINDAKQTKRLRAFLTARGLLAWAGVVGLVAAPVVASYTLMRMRI